MWNKIDHQAKMGNSVNKLLTHLESKGITMIFDDLDNLVFTNKDGKIFKISDHSFYRYSGIAQLSKTIKDSNLIDVFPVTDEMYLNMFIKPVIEHNLL